MPSHCPALAFAGAFALGIWTGAAFGEGAALAAAAAGLAVLLGAHEAALRAAGPILGRPSAARLEAAFRSARRPAAFLLLGAWRGAAPLPEPAPAGLGDAPAVSISGVVDTPPVVLAEDAPDRTPLTHFSLAPASRLSVRVRSRGEIPWLRGGDRIRATGRLLPPLGARNPGDPRGQGTGLLLVKSPSHVEPDPAARAPLARAVLGRVRGKCAETILKIHAPELRGLILAMVLGDRRLLTDAVGDALMGTGMYHLLAISGFHVVVVVALAIRMPFPRRLAAPARWCILGGFTLLTGASPPVVRASTMFAVHEVLALSGRSSPSLNVLGTAALAMLAADPSVLFDAGFQLSFLAVLAILTWGARLGGGQGPLRAALAVSVATNVCTAPLTALYFQRLHPLGPAWNLLAAPLTLVTFLGGLLSLLAGLVDLSLGRAAARAVDALAGTLIAVLAAGARVPGSSIMVPAPPPLLVGAALATLAAGWLCGRRGAAVLAAALVFSGACAWSLLAPRRAEVVVFDVGEGQAALVSLPGSEPILLDAGGPGRRSPCGRRLARAILAAGCPRIGAVLLTHAHDDHTRGFPGLLELLPARELWISPPFWKGRRGAEHTSFAKDRGMRAVEVSRGCRGAFPRSPGFSLEILHPGDEEPLIDPRSENDFSLALRLRGPGSSVLFLGDLEDPGLARVLGTCRDLEADVVVAPHHGRPGRLWEVVLARAKPRFVVFSGAGTPEEREVARAAEERGAAVYATWRAGAIRIAWERRAGWTPRYWYRPEGEAPGGDPADLNRAPRGCSARTGVSGRLSP